MVEFFFYGRGDPNLLYRQTKFGIIMTNQRNSFILHLDSLEVLEKLTDEQAGKIFKAIRIYQKTGEIVALDFALEIALLPFLNQFKRDSENYLKVCEARRLAGGKGGKQKVANASKSKQKVANLADSDSKSDSDSDSDSKKDSKNKSFSPPTLQEVSDYCQERKNSVSPNKFIDHYQSNGWKVGKNSMRDWKAAVRKWEDDKPTNQDPLANNLNQIAGGNYFQSVVLGDVAKITCVAGMKTKAYSLPTEIKEKIKAQFQQPIEIK